MERRLWRDVAFKPMRNLLRVSAHSSFISVHRPFLLALLFTFRIATAADEPAFFPLMAWGSAPNDPAALRKMHECGLNVAGFASPAALDAIHAAGLKAIVNDPRVADYDWTNVDEKMARPKIAALIVETARHPAVYGYYLRDEPPASFFPGLAKVSALIRELAPDKWAYINLFPNYATAGQLGASDYTEYLDQFVATCKPTTLSYDHYALLDNNTLREGYWLNLEQLAAASKKHGVPFWNIVLTVAHFNYREPAAADLRFQAYSTLLYGGRGLSYFTYIAPQVGNYRMAPIDQFGNATATWDALRSINLQLLKLAPTFLQLRWDDAYHFGTVPTGCHGSTEHALVRNVGGQMAVGDFTHPDGTRYVMVLNKDLQKSMPCSLQFRTPPRKVELISAYSGTPVAFEGEQVWLSPGQAALLKLTLGP